MVLEDAVFSLLWDMPSNPIPGRCIFSTISEMVPREKEIGCPGPGTHILWHSFRSNGWTNNGQGLTCHSIQTWALEEARRRLEAEGILEDPEAKK